VTRLYPVSIMSSGVAIFQRAEDLYAHGDIQGAFDLYQTAVKKIIKNENVIAKLPAIVPDDFPQETLGAIWRNFVGFFRDPAMSFTQTSDPEAYKLLNSFRPSAEKSHAKFEKTSRRRVLLKGMQITAGLTLGLLAWDNRDRPTAAKRYKEALDLAASHPSFTVLAPGTVGLEKWVYLDIQQVKANLGCLVENDTIHAQMLGRGEEGNAPNRKDVVELPLPQMRYDKSGEVTAEGSVTFVTDACTKCGKRDVKLMRCSLCKKAPCESRAADFLIRRLTSLC
jgi:hypothetical protein